MRLVLPPLALLVACNGCGGPAAPPAAPPATTTPATTTATAPAATTRVYGLQLGATDPAGIDAWLASHGLTCPAVESPRRATMRYACSKDAGLTATTLPEHPVLGGGQLYEVLLARGDTAPLTHLAVTRRFSLPADATADYTTALASLTTTFGEPSRSAGAPDPARFGGAMAHWSADWRFTDLSVHLSILKAGGDYIAVSERYDVPGASDAEGARGPATLEPTPGGDPFGFDKIPGMTKPSWHQ